jgi:hypothetical protein
MENSAEQVTQILEAVSAGDEHAAEKLLPPVYDALLDGFDGIPFSGDCPEVALDIEMAVAMAPGLSRIIVYEVSGDTSTSVKVGKGR